jgi:hypothetical protein
MWGPHIASHNLRMNSSRGQVRTCRRSKRSIPRARLQDAKRQNVQRHDADDGPPPIKGVGRMHPHLAKSSLLLDRVIRELK